MDSIANILRAWPGTASFYADEISFVCVIANLLSVQTQAQGQKGTANDSEGTDLHGNFGLKCVPMTADQVRAAYCSSEHENSLRDVYFEVTLNMEADEQRAFELFQEFGPLISVKFKNGFFTRTGI